MAIHNYESTLGVFPKYRQCDTTGGLTMRIASRSPRDHLDRQREVWWAPYDNRPSPSTTTNAQGSPNPDNTIPTAATRPAPVAVHGGEPKTFKCPNGIDPATGQAYQCSYGMNYVNGGPNGKSLITLTNGNGTSNILIVWDHGKTPGCADSTHAATAANPRGPWPFPDTTTPHPLPGPAAHERVQRPVLRRPHDEHDTDRG